jgi:4-alpha-glucanotransferase
MSQQSLMETFLAKKRAGVLVPLFSVYSKNSFGVGDLSDLKLVIDWAQDTNHSIVQLLPMNEMGGLLCPYDSLSSFALEPVYISLLDADLPKDKSFKRQIESLRKNIPASKTYLNYAVRGDKLRIMREIFMHCDLEENPDFAKFRQDNAYWLGDFSLFKALKDNFNGAAWFDWPDEYRNRDQKTLGEFRRQHSADITFQEWMQWQLFKQFKDAKEYAHSKKLFLKGDLPILVSRDSADVWVHPEFFKLEFAAGAPPDMYCAKGQRWGMPTYNWEKIKSDGYKYLKEKLRYAQNFYDILRVDHVVGLFRIWSIPYSDSTQNQGLNGFFDPRDEWRWKGQGRELLEVMQQSSSMFLCAEDLGVIPPACTETLKDLKIPGNDVQRWVKDWNVRHDFLAPQDYRKFSVAMLSTHDTTNWPAWWENEAGTVDEALFIRKCSDQRNIGYDYVKNQLFDPVLSRHGRLRWRQEVNSVDELLTRLSCGRHFSADELRDFIELYENSFQEKDKLWKALGLKGQMRENCTSALLQAILYMSFQTSSLFVINTIFDLLFLGDTLKGDPYQYRINTPGTVSDKNWSLLLPLSVEELKKSPINKEIREMVVNSERSV